MTKEGFAERVEGMIPSLYRVCYALLPSPPDREDAVQGALLSAYANLHKLREERYFKTWLTRILINECNAIARERGGWAFGAHGDDPAAPESPDPALLQLPARLKLPIVMHYMDGYAIRDTRDRGGAQDPSGHGEGSDAAGEAATILRIDGGVIA